MKFTTKLRILNIDRLGSNVRGELYHIDKQHFNMKSSSLQVDLLDSKIPSCHPSH